MQNSNSEAQKRFLELEAQEKALIFDSFSRADALSVGLKILDLAKSYSDPIAVEIALNGLVVFRHFSDGSIADSSLWLERKRNSVELMSMSSLRFNFWLERANMTLEDRKLSPDDYVAGGGGFPVALKNTGMIGSICVSGLPNGQDDHDLIVAALKDLKTNQTV